MDQKGATAGLIKKIQDINGNPAYTAEDKKRKIRELQGMKFEDMIDYLQKNFRTGPALHPSIKKIISSDRPKKNKSKWGVGKF